MFKIEKVLIFLNSDWRLIEPRAIDVLLVVDGEEGEELWNKILDETVGYNNIFLSKETKMANRVEGKGKERKVYDMIYMPGALISLPKGVPSITVETYLTLYNDLSYAIKEQGIDIIITVNIEDLFPIKGPKNLSESSLFKSALYESFKYYMNYLGVSEGVEFTSDSPVIKNRFREQIRRYKTKFYQALEDGRIAHIMECFYSLEGIKSEAINRLVYVLMTHYNKLASNDNFRLLDKHMYPYLLRLIFKVDNPNMYKAITYNIRILFGINRGHIQMRNNINPIKDLSYFINDPGNFSLYASALTSGGFEEGDSPYPSYKDLLNPSEEKELKSVDSYGSKAFKVDTNSRDLYIKQRLKVIFETLHKTQYSQLFYTDLIEKLTLGVVITWEVTNKVYDSIFGYEEFAHAFCLGLYMQDKPNYEVTNNIGYKGEIPIFVNVIGGKYKLGSYNTMREIEKTDLIPVLTKQWRHKGKRFNYIGLFYHPVPHLGSPQVFVSAFNDLRYPDIYLKAFDELELALGEPEIYIWNAQTKVLLESPIRGSIVDETEY